MGHRVGAHGTAEDQQNGGKDGGLHHGQGDAGHGLPLGGVQNGGGFLQVGIHVAEDAADEDVGKGGVVQAQHHHAGEQTLAPPHGHLNAEEGGQQPVGGAGDGVGVKQILPHHSQGPLGHDVGEDKDGTDVLAPCHVGAGDQEGHNAAEENGNDAGAHRQQNRIEQGRPQVGFRHAAGEQVNVVDDGIADCLAGQVGVDGAGMDFQGILHDGHDGGDGGDGEDNAHQQQDHVIGLGEKGLGLIQPDGEAAGGTFGSGFHGTSFGKRVAPPDRLLGRSRGAVTLLDCHFSGI